MKIYQREAKKITIKQAKELWKKQKNWDAIRKTLHEDYGISGQKSGIPPYWLALDLMELKLKKPLRKGSKKTHIEEIEENRKIKKPKNSQTHKKQNASNFVFTKKYVEEKILPIIIDLDRNKMSRKEIAEAINNQYGHSIDDRKVRHWLHFYYKGKYIPKREETPDDDISVESIEIIAALAKTGKTADQIYSILERQRNQK
jgi:hypothetical protein